MTYERWASLSDTERAYFYTKIKEKEKREGGIGGRGT
jgi:hypothetical protein